MSEAARRYCAQITRRQAANFYYGMRLLPAPKREALFAIYAFARRIDDIGDGTLPAAPDGSCSTRRRRPSAGRRAMTR